MALYTQRMNQRVSLNYINHFTAVVIASVMMLGAGCTGPTFTPISTQPVSSSTRLDLSGSGLKRVPSYVFDRTDLVELDLSDNELSGALQAEIRQLGNLQVLDMSGNAMTGVPAEIGQLSALQELDLAQNQLTGLPMELGNLRNLRRLDLRGNAVSKQDLDAIRSKLVGTEILE